MTVRNWIGNAQPRPDVWWARPGIVPNNSSIFVMAINEKEIKVKAGDLDSGGTATAITAADVTKLLKEAIGRAAFPEWKEVTVFRAFLNTDEVTYTKATDTGDMLVMTGPSDGKPVTITCRTETTTAPEVLITEVTKGVVGVNEKQTITFGSAATGGTFTLSYAGEATDAIAFDADAAAVDSALEANANIAPGDVTVTGVAGAWVVEFTGALAQTNVPTITGDGASLTGAGSVVVTTDTEGVSSASGETKTGYGTGDTGTSYRFKWVYSWGVVYGEVGKYYPGNLESGGIYAVALMHIDLPYNYRVTATATTAGTLSIEQKSLYGDTWSGAYFNSLTFTGVTAGVNEVQRVRVYTATGGHFHLIFQGQTTGEIAWNATPATVAANIQTALWALSNIADSEATVAVSTATATYQDYTVTFSGALGSLDLEQMTADAASLTGGFVLVSTTQAAVVAVNEVQSISLPNNPSAGTFTLTYSGQTTTAIAYDASAATVDAALEALSNIGAGDVSVSGTASNWTVTFTTALAATDVALMTGNGYGLTITGTQTIQVHRAQTRRYTGGTWVQATRVFTPGGAVVPSSEGIAVGDYACVFRDGAVGQTAFMAKVTARDTTTITLSADYFDDVAEGGNPADGTSDTTLLIVTAPTGPNYYGDTDNWSGATLPVDADTINAENTAVPILYEMNQSLITPAIIYWTASFQASVGLPEQTASGYREYRRKALLIGNAADAQTITIEIGKGEGAGQSLVNMDNGAARVTGKVYRTSTSKQTNLPTVLWKGTHASNAWQIQRGSFGAGMFSGDTFVIATLNLDWSSSRERDAQVILGSGGTVTTIVKTGGSLVSYSAFTTLTQEAGETVLHVGAAGTVNLRGGTYVHNSSGTYTALSVYDATADFSKSGQALTGTNTTLYANATFLDTNKRITFTNPIAIHGRVRQLDLGVDLNLQRS